MQSAWSAGTALASLVSSVAAVSFVTAIDKPRASLSPDRISSTPRYFFSTRDAPAIRSVSLTAQCARVAL
jgi:hypothetical protein